MIAELPVIEPIKEQPKSDDLVLVRNLLGKPFEFTWDSKVYRVPYHKNSDGELVNAEIFTREIGQQAIRRAYRPLEADDKKHGVMVEELPPEQRRTEGFGTIAANNEVLKKELSEKDAEIMRLKAMLNQKPEPQPIQDMRKVGRPKGS